MKDEKNDDSTESNSFKPIRDFLEGGYEHREISIGVLATAIEDEKIGIYTWDRFGRFRQADKAAKEKILNFLASIYEYENDPDAYQSKEHPLDYIASFPWEDPFSLFGWPIDDIPGFEEITRQSNKTNIPPPKPPQAKAGDTKKQNTYLIIIGALCKELYNDINTRGIAPNIQTLIQKLGVNRDEGTIRAVLKNTQEAIDAEIE